MCQCPAIGCFFPSNHDYSGLVLGMTEKNSSLAGGRKKSAQGLARPPGNTNVNSGASAQGAVLLPVAAFAVRA